MEAGYKMKIAIMGRERIERLAQQPFPERTAVISITDSDALPVEFRNSPDFLLALEFDDMEPESDLLDELLKGYPDFQNEYQIITERQAEKIANFSTVIYQVADLLICQCEFGQSRSAAVAAAIMEHFSGNGIDVFADDRYCPNKYIFRKVLGKLLETQHYVNQKRSEE